MKQIFKLLTIIFCTSNVYGQIDGVESLMTRRYLSCQDIEYNVQFLIPEFYKKDSKDTLKAIIDYWEKHCGLTEEIIRCKILLAIENDNFNESIYDSDILDYIVSYKNLAGSLRNKYVYMDTHYDWYYYTNQPDTLRNFTACLAKDLLERDDLEPIEIFFLKMYSNEFETAFSMLQSDEFLETKIQKYYLDKIKRYKRQIVSHGDFLLGAWIPKGNLEIVGTHPFVGFRGGLQYYRLIADVSVGFKLDKSPNIYQVYTNDSVWNTDYFFGAFFGLDFALEMFRIKNSSFDLIGGAGYDGFDALKVDDPNSKTDITKTINALNLNIGIGYKYNINPWKYIGIDFKYNIVDYNNEMGTDLSGNTLTINLIYGFFGNRYYGNGLNDL